MKNILTSLLLLTAVSASSLVAQSSSPAPTAPSPNSSADNSTNPSFFPIGSTETPATVGEYVAFLNDSYSSATANLSWYEHLYPHYYAHQLLNKVNPTVDTLLRVVKEPLSSASSSLVSCKYSDSVDPKNTEVINYTFTYSANQEDDNKIITSINSQEVADNFNNNWRSSDAYKAWAAENNTPATTTGTSKKKGSHKNRADQAADASN